MSRALSLLLAFVVVVPAHGFAYGVLAEETANGTSRVATEFVARGGGARAAAMGEVVAAVADDVTAAGWNPAGLGRLASWGVVFTHDGSRGVDLDGNYIGAAVPTKWGAVSVSWIGLSYGDYEVRDDAGFKTGTDSLGERAVTVGYGLAHPKGLGIPGWSGVTVSSVTDVWSRGSVTAGVGTIIPVSARFDLGAAVMHLGSGVEGLTAPTTLRAGAGFRPLNPVGAEFRRHFRIAADGVYGLGDERLSLAVGCELRLGKLEFRGGYRYQVMSLWPTDQGGMSMGFGLLIRNATLEYAYQALGDLAGSHRMGLTLGGRD